MSADGSTGRRDGFERWVASMKRDHQPVSPRSAALTPGTTPSAKPSTLEKLELELDDQATHVHRIPKELINRMREREQAREQAKQAEDSIPPSDEQEAPSDDGFSGMAAVSDDRTAVFRPPPELLARAKRMRPPAKPNPQSEAPTKPPPAPAADDPDARAAAAPAIPAAPMMPVMAPISTAPGARPSPMTPAAPRPTPLVPKREVAPRATPPAPAARPAATAAPAPVARTAPAANVAPASAPSSSPSTSPPPAPPSSPSASSNDAVAVGRVVPVAPAIVAGALESASTDAPHAEAAEPPARGPVPSSTRTSDVSSLIPLLTDPTEGPAFDASSRNAAESAPRSEVVPSSAEIATAFSTDASADSGAPSSAVARAPLVSEAPPGAGASLARWIVAILVAAAFGMSLISWFRR